MAHRSVDSTQVSQNGRFVDYGRYRGRGCKGSKWEGHPSKDSDPRIQSTELARIAGQEAHRLCQLSLRDADVEDAHMGF